MKRHPAAKWRCASSGFTLLELLLVLAILVAVSALAVPALRGPIEGYRLRGAADLIRTEWGRARNEAIRTGNIQIFQYEVGGNLYFIEPWFTGQDELEAAETDTGQSRPMSGGGGAVADAQQLADNILFAQGEAAEDARLGDVEQAGGSAPGVSAATGTPIVFYPDGTATTARVILQNDQDQYIVLDLRGLTAIAQVSDLLSQQDLP